MITNTKLDGGQAFPRAGNHYTRYDGAFVTEDAEMGMSLRDWFAGQALAGLATNQETLSADDDLIKEFGTLGIDKLQANKAYRLADAMIAERERTK